MVDCKTVFTNDFANQAEYERFYEVLARAFPNLHAKAKRLTFGSGCFVYVLEGKDAKKNVMLMPDGLCVLCTGPVIYALRDTVWRICRKRAAI